MASETSFDESSALILYHQHKTDSEIAKGVRSLTATIRNWRKRRGLPNISPNARPAQVGKKKVQYPGETGGVDYRKALTKEQAKEMNRFLRSLSWATNKAKEAGVKPNVDAFIRAWQGKPVTEEGIKDQARANARYYDAKKRERRRLSASKQSKCADVSGVESKGTSERSGGDQHENHYAKV